MIIFQCLLLILNYKLKFYMINENEFSSLSTKMSISDFKKLKVIGKGSFAKVIQAEHIKSRKVFAIKIIDKIVIEKVNH